MYGKAATFILWNMKKNCTICWKPIIALITNYYIINIFCIIYIYNSENIRDLAISRKLLNKRAHCSIKRFYIVGSSETTCATLSALFPSLIILFDEWGPVKDEDIVQIYPKIYYTMCSFPLRFKYGCCICLI